MQDLRCRSCSGERSVVYISKHYTVLNNVFAFGDCESCNKHQTIYTQKL